MRAVRTTPRFQRRHGGVGLALAAVAAVGIALGGCGDSAEPATSGDGSKRLVINSFGGAWGEAIELGLVEQFEDETGIDVEVLSTADAAKSKIAIEQGNEPPEDILDTDFATAVAMDRDGVAAPIDYGSFDQATLEKIPAFAKPEFAVGWGQFAIGLCYDKRKFPDRAPATWSDFWDVRSFPGKRGMLEWPVEPQPEFGLLADGVPASDLYPVDVERAFAKLEELRPSVPQFARDPAALQQQLIDGTVAMEACYTGRVQTLIDDGIDYIGISYDQARLNNEYFIVWKNAPNRENAMRFLDFVLHAEPQAKWARLGNTGPVNPDAFANLSEEVAAKLPTAPQYRDRTFVAGDRWYAEQQDGQTNQERIVEAWSDRVSGGE